MKAGLIRLGRTPSGADVHLDLFAPAHTLVTGRTRSGKSVQVYGILAQLKGLPVRVAGVDPSGLVFNALGPQLGGDELRVLTLREPEKVGQVLEQLLAIMDDRIQRLLAERKDKFDEFSPDFPLILAVFEEYPGLLAALEALDKASGAKVADRLETKVRAAIQRLALEGAKVGVRLLLVAQRADANLLTGVLRSQLTQRVSFAQDAEGLKMLHPGISEEQIEASARFLPGQAFAELPNSGALLTLRADLITYPQLVRRFQG